MAKSVPYFEPEKELTEKEKLQAALVNLTQKIPGGYQLAMPLRIDTTIDLITELFPAYNLPHQAELIAELQAWQHHITQARPYVDRCQDLMTAVFAELDTRSDDARTPAPPPECLEPHHDA